MPKVSVNKLLQDVVSINNQVQGLNILLAQKKAILANYFEKSGNRKIESDECTVYVTEKPNIIYDVEAIEKKLPKKVYKKFIDVTHEVQDWSRFVELMRAKGISPTDIRPYISVTKKVNQEKLSRCYECGLLKLVDLAGCYSAEVKKSVVLKMKNVNAAIPIENRGKGG